MTQPIKILSTERGLVRLFSLSMTDAEAKALRDDSRAQNLILQAEVLDTHYVEIFPVSDLDELGLDGYLISGY